MRKLHNLYGFYLAIGWVVVAPVAAFADEVTITLTPEIAYVDTVVNVDTTTAYVITTTTGPRTEVVDSVTVERVAWVDSWITLYRGVAIDSGTVIAQDDDSNHNTQTNFYASRLAGTLTPDTYTIRATSYDFIVANQRPIGTYTLSSNLINLPDTNTATVDTGTATGNNQTITDTSTTTTDTSTATPTNTTEPLTPVPSQPQETVSVPVVPPSLPPQPIVIDINPEPISTIPPQIPEPQLTEPVVLQDTPPVSVPAIEETLLPLIPEPTQENQLEEPFETPIVETEPITQIEENLEPITVAELETLVENLDMGGVVTAQDSVEILEALSQDGEITQTEVNNLSEQLSTDGTFTESERELVAEALIESAEGQAVTVEAIAEAGITLADLPPSTPVEVRQDANGNEVIVIAEVAAALVILESPVELLSTIFSDPAQALLAISSIGADMSDEERSESEQTIVTAVIVTGIAVQSATTAALAGSVSYRRRL